MLLTKKSRDNRRKEIEAAIKSEEQEIRDYQNMMSEFKNKYLPLRDKCVEIIRSHNLGRYKLYDVYGYKYEAGKLRVVVYCPKEEYWDGEPKLNYDNKLLDETISMNIPEAYDSLIINGGSYALRKLMDPTWVFEGRIHGCEQYIDELKAKLAKLNK